MITIADAAARLAPVLGGDSAAWLAALALIEADMIGQPRFGLDMLDEWAPDARAIPEPEVLQSVTWLDCAGCFAPHAVAMATLHMVPAARQFGVTAMFLRGVRGFGRLAPFVRHLADEGLLAMAGAEGPPFVAPWQGKRAVIGTNPFALALGRGTDRVVIDMASSATTMAALRSAKVNGTPLPAGLALDATGGPTRMAAEVAALLPRGGQLGSLLGLIVELLAGVAGGGRGDPRGRGVFLLAIDPEHSGGLGDLPARLAALRTDWTTAGGYWPGAQTITEDDEVPDAVLHRLTTHLARMTRAATDPLDACR